MKTIYNTDDILNTSYELSSLYKPKKKNYFSILKKNKPKHKITIPLNSSNNDNSLSPEIISLSQRTLNKSISKRKITLPKVISSINLIKKEYKINLNNNNKVNDYYINSSQINSSNSRPNVFYKTSGQLFFEKLEKTKNLKIHFNQSLKNHNNISDSISTNLYSLSKLNSDRKKKNSFSFLFDNFNYNNYRKNNKKIKKEIPLIEFKDVLLNIIRIIHIYNEKNKYLKEEKVLCNIEEELKHYCLNNLNVKIEEKEEKKNIEKFSKEIFETFKNKNDLIRKYEKILINKNVKNDDQILKNILKESYSKNKINYTINNFYHEKNYSPGKIFSKKSSYEHISSELITKLYKSLSVPNRNKIKQKIILNNKKVFDGLENSSLSSNYNINSFFSSSNNQDENEENQKFLFENINSINYNNNNKVIKNTKFSNEMIKQKYQNIIIDNNNYHRYDIKDNKEKIENIENPNQEVINNIKNMRFDFFNFKTENNNNNYVINNNNNNYIIQKDNGNNILKNEDIKSERIENNEIQSINKNELNLYNNHNLKGNKTSYNIKINYPYSVSSKNITNSNFPINRSSNKKDVKKITIDNYNSKSERKEKIKKKIKKGILKKGKKEDTNNTKYQLNNDIESTKSIASFHNSFLNNDNSEINEKINISQNNNNNNNIDENKKNNENYNDNKEEINNDNNNNKKIENNNNEKKNNENNNVNKNKNLIQKKAIEEKKEVLIKEKETEIEKEKEKEDLNEKKENSNEGKIKLERKLKKFPDFLKKKESIKKNNIKKEFNKYKSYKRPKLTGLLEAINLEKDKKSVLDKEKLKRKLLGNLLNELDNSSDSSSIEMEKIEREKTKETRKLKFIDEQKLMYKKNSANLMLKLKNDLTYYLSQNKWDNKERKELNEFKKKIENYQLTNIEDYINEILDMNEEIKEWKKIREIEKRINNFNNRLYEQLNYQRAKRDKIQEHLNIINNIF